ncbi:MAG: dUTP diphosphatase [Flavobacteriales bacterium]|nr:dUTP diphosphatase [Flavobacteriales bacterium]
MAKIRIINESGNKLPAYETSSSAGMDLMAYLEETVVLKPLERALIPTGMKIELPNGYEAQIRSRSGLSLKKGLIVLNAPGTIDADYRGDVGIIAMNMSNQDIEINNGDRIAQMVISKYEKIEWLESVELSDSERGQGGFGHTGIN